MSSNACFFYKLRWYKLENWSVFCLTGRCPTCHSMLFNLFQTVDELRQAELEPATSDDHLSNSLLASELLSSRVDVEARKFLHGRLSLLVNAAKSRLEKNLQKASLCPCFFEFDRNRFKFISYRFLANKKFATLTVFARMRALVFNLVDWITAKVRKAVPELHSFLT